MAAKYLDVPELLEIGRLTVRTHAVHLNRSCGLHVPVLNRNFGFPIQTGMHLATLVACFEQQVNRV